VSTELDDGAVLLNPDTKYYYILNESGLRIWQLMDQCSSIDGIANELVNEYAVDLERVKSSVQRLLKELKKEKIILVTG